MAKRSSSKKVEVERFIKIVAGQQVAKRIIEQGGKILSNPMLMGMLGYFITTNIDEDFGLGFIVAAVNKFVEATTSGVGLDIDSVGYDFDNTSYQNQTDLPYYEQQLDNIIPDDFALGA